MAVVFVHRFLWLLFVFVWVFLAMRIESKGTLMARSRNAIGLGVLTVVFLVYQATILAIVSPEVLSTGGETMRFIGAITTALGLGIAFWARVHLNTNWGMPMSQKSGDRLVMTGPYRFVRHPIYFGILVALLGSMALSVPLWAGPFLACMGYFAIAVIKEEHRMSILFPETYSTYQKKTKILIPFLY